MAKKHMILVGSIGSFLYVAGLFTLGLHHSLSDGGIGICDRNVVWCAGDLWRLLAPILFHFVIILVFSLTTYKMRDEVSKIWIKFIYVWVPILIVVSLLSISTSFDGYFWLSILPYLFAFISLFLVIYMNARTIFIKNTEN